MQIIPVIDLKDGNVVRGIGGRRDEYRPIVSQLAPSAQPAEVANAFVRLGLSTIYVADLDAIADRPPATHHYQQMRAAGATLWIDAGVDTIGRAQSISYWAGHIVVGSETLTHCKTLAELNREFPERIIFSLDLKQGKMLTRVEQWQRLRPVDIGREVLDLGIRKMIVLDLAKVGGFDGAGTEQLCRELAHHSPSATLIGGGGVRSAADLASLEAAGCRAALVASALHDRRLTVADVAV